MHGEGQHDVQVVPLAPEPLIGRDLKRHVEIARRAAVRAHVPELGEAQPRAVVRAGRNVDGHRLRPGVQTDAATRPARLHPLHARTRRSAGTRARRPCVPARHAAGRSRGSACRCEPGPRSVPAPAHASHRACRVIVNRRSVPRSASSNGSTQRGVQVGAARVPCGLALTREHLREQIAEGALLHGVHAVPRNRSPRTRPTRPRLRLIAEHVVPPPPLRIAQGLVRLGDLLEPHRRDVVTRVDVRMKTSRQPAVGTLHVGHRRRARDAEDNVEIHI